MARRPRKQSKAKIYHVVQRGVEQRDVFLDDKDRRVFLGLLGKKLTAYECLLFAWCLMDNHFHLAIKADLERMAQLMHDVQSSYARYFNSRYGRVGHLFQGRYWSGAIDSDEQLMCVIRYIHRNPVEAGICDACGGYEWSSYSEYMGRQHLTSTRFVIGILGGLKSFIGFHEKDVAPRVSGSGFLQRRRRADREVRSIFKRLVGEGKGLSYLKDCGPKVASLLVNLLLLAGASLRQLAELSGTSVRFLTSCRDGLEERYSFEEMRYQLGEQIQSA